jgi:hypothetical protein
VRRFAQAGALAGHKIRIRDRRFKFGDPECYAAECSCGWAGTPRIGANAERLARRDGTEHIDQLRDAANTNT